MPRKAREKSESGIYHVMLRGINRQTIFEDEEDYRKFLLILLDYQTACGYKLYAYCLMPNHIHLLIREGEEPLEQVFKRVSGKFVYWYNAKYRRTGHLFQDRFRSEPVNTDSYFLTVLRYIHQNPRKANLCRDLNRYKYSSYRTYARNPLIDCEFTFGILSRDEFAEFNEADVQENCLDVTDEVGVRLTDEEVRNRLFHYAGCSDILQFKMLEESKQARAIRKLKEDDIAIRQISRVSDISCYYIKQL